MVNCIYRLQAGPLGVLQVDKDHLQQGLGSLVCKAVSKQLGALGLDVCACVDQENVPSNTLFERAGFTIIDSTYWIRPYASVPQKWVD